MEIQKQKLKILDEFANKGCLESFMNSYFTNFLMMVYDYSFESYNITDCLMVDDAMCLSVRVLEYQRVSFLI